ncbi:hypothetical protein ACNQFN_11380 [Thauera butanivorans]|uniref:hypothetical protein n=1 Tax=Thauera butanivorans TaxID=86174 RepID=UPI003AB6B7E8
MMSAIASQHPNPLPTLPLYAHHSPDHPSDIHASDGRLVAMVSMPGNASPQPVADLFALAPELLADLAGLLHALMLHDPDYRNKHAPDTDRVAAEESIFEAASNAVATLSYAVSCGLPVVMPGLDQLEDKL